MCQTRQTREELVFEPYWVVVLSFDGYLLFEHFDWWYLDRNRIDEGPKLTGDIIQHQCKQHNYRGRLCDIYQFWFLIERSQHSLVIYIPPENNCDADQHAVLS